MARGEGFAVAAVLAWLGLPAPTVAQPPGQPAATPPRWQIDAVVGLAGLAPEDLNARVDCDTAWLEYLRPANVAQEHEGTLDGIDGAIPVSMRVVRRLGRHWSVGAGFSYLSSRVESSASASYRYTVIDPKAQEYRRTFDQSLEVGPLAMEVREYLPHAVAGWDMALGSRMRVGALVTAGLAVMDVELRRSSIARGGFYATDRRTDLVMTGHGNGVAADVMLTARFALAGRVALLAEGGFAWHEVNNVTGALDSTTRIQDGEATDVEREVVSRVEGRWVNQPVSVQGASGTWNGSVPSIGTQGAPFGLSLSGWQVRAGVSFGL